MARAKGDSDVTLSAVNTANAIKTAPRHQRVRLAIEMMRIGKPISVALLVAGFESGASLRAELKAANRDDLARTVPEDAEPWKPTARDVYDAACEISTFRLKALYVNNMPGRGHMF